MSIVQIDNNRFSAIKVSIDNRFFMIINVYMPTDTAENFPLFAECLGEMYALIENRGIESVFVLGDFNAHPDEPFCNELLNLCSEHELMCVDIDNLGIRSSTFTFISEAHGCRRWLDHCVVTRSAGQTVESAEVVYDSYWSDHLPLLIKCNINAIRVKTTLKKTAYNEVIWGERKSGEISNYLKYCHNKLKNIDLPPEFSYCVDNVCCDPFHKNLIKDLYTKIVSTLCEGAIHSRDTVPRRNKVKSVMGWNNM